MAPTGLPPPPTRVWLVVASAFAALTTLALAGMGLDACADGCAKTWSSVTASGTGVMPLLSAVVVWAVLAVARDPLPQRAVVVAFVLLHATIVMVWVLDGLLGLDGMPGATWGAPTAVIGALAAVASLLPRFAPRDTSVPTGL